MPFGRPVLVLALIAVAAGIVVAIRPAPARTDLTLWVSADQHARLYRAGPLDDFTRSTGKTVRLDLIAPAALDVRLLSLLMTTAGGTSVESAPDLVELDLGSVGKFLRPPVDRVGLLPLNDYLRRSGWDRRLVRSRLTPWSKDGVVFGIPHDLHPCTFTYRKDLFDQAGVDLESAGTWDELARRCRLFQRYWQAHGIPRAAVGFSSTNPDTLMVLLQQQRIDLVDSDGTIHLADPAVVKTLAWYAAVVAGPDSIAADFNPSPGRNAADLSDGSICGLITPDWMIGDLKRFGPGLSGKLHMIPLPRFNPTDAPTTAWGGTMIGILRSSKHPDEAWKLIERLYLTPRVDAADQIITDILPPVPEFWPDPAYHRPDEFFGGQKIDELYLSLAEQIPPRTMTPYTTTAQTFLTLALNDVVGHVRRDGTAGVEAYCRAALEVARGRLERLVAFDRQGQGK
jgi:arabinosaccharide transport system substrate-binding protein